MLEVLPKFLFKHFHSETMSGLDNLVPTPFHFIKRRTNRNTIPFFFIEIDFKFIKQILKLKFANFTVILQPSIVPISSLIELICETNPQEKSNGQVRDNYKCYAQNSNEKCSHSWIFPFDQILVLLKVITIFINYIKCIWNALLTFLVLCIITFVYLYVVLVMILQEIFLLLLS